MGKRRYESRRERLRRLMVRDGFDALLITHCANRFYLSGFELHDGQCNESSGCLIITKDGKDWLCTDSRFEIAARELWDKERICIYSGPSSLEVGALLRSLKPDRVGFESQTLSWDYTWHLQNGLFLESAHGLVEELRVIKEEEELTLIEESVRLNHEMFSWLPSCLTVGGDEAQIAWNLEKYFRDHGASELSFPAIVAKNAHAALPHYSPMDKPAHITPNCQVMVDAGARLKHYCSDQTRSFWVGDKPEPRFLEILDMVRNAQQAAIAQIRPGAIARDIHKAAVDSFAEHGMEQYFTHSLGHGVGLEVHEEPRLSPRSHTVIQEGMVITVEPGLYFPDWGGVRWEYMVAVTEDGCRIL